MIFCVTSYQLRGLSVKWSAGIKGVLWSTPKQAVYCEVSPQSGLSRLPGRKRKLRHQAANMQPAPSVVFHRPESGVQSRRGVGAVRRDPEWILARQPAGR